MVSHSTKCELQWGVSETGEQDSARSFNPLNEISERVQKIVAESPFPNKDYQSTCGVYGGRLVTSPVLNLPDIIWNPDKEFGRAEQKATDMLDFMISIGVEELNRTGNWDQVKTALQTIVESYGSDRTSKDDIIKWTGSLAQRGRLTLNHPVFTKLHNFARLGIKPEWADPLRQLVIEVCNP